MVSPRLLRLSLILLGLLVTAVPATAQVSIGVDLMSRYIWRGYDFGESASIQPTLEYSTGPLTIGSWAAYSISSDGAGATEHDLYVSFTAGAFTAGLTDYYFPVPSSIASDNTAQFFNFDDGGEGAHHLEPFVSFAGPEAAPVTLTAAIVAYNDPDHSVYLEASYPFVVQDVSLSVTAGMTPASSTFYRTNKAGLINLGLSASEAIPITDRFSLPISVSYIMNPYAERTFLVFGLSLRL